MLKNDKHNIFYYNSPLGRIGIAENDDRITHISYFKENLPDGNTKETFLIKKTYIELIQYFEGERKTFDIPLNPTGTEFQKRVWSALMTIPYGETRSYKQIAEIIENPNAQRAVGMANNKNPIPIIIPCHRVIGADKKLVGYAGGLDIKQKLLDIEAVK